MARFYGSVKGSRGCVTRLGGPTSGMSVIAAGWQGGVKVTLFNKDDVDYCTVRLIPWQGVGREHVLYEGPVNPDHIGRRIADEMGVDAGGQYTLVGQRHKKDPA